MGIQLRLSLLDNDGFLARARSRVRPLRVVFVHSTKHRDEIQVEITKEKGRTPKLTVHYIKLLSFLTIEWSVGVD